MGGRITYKTAQEKCGDHFGSFFPSCNFGSNTKVEHPHTWRRWRCV